MGQMSVRQKKANWLGKKQKPNEPSLRDKLSENFMRAFEADFSEHGIDAIKALREKSPEKYSEIAARLIAAIESKPDGFGNCSTMEQIGRKLLQSVGADDAELTDAMIAEAVAANDTFIAKLEEIRNNALMAAAGEPQGELN
jgi:hypothetical protein